MEQETRPHFIGRYPLQMEAHRTHHPIVRA
ncbi:Uncharacterised protein [Mycobacteroides abscessus subsp. abscessus]|nr:Uncharacterised protein [Mycobacteroides abscessus subsp. abscessus]